MTEGLFPFVLKKVSVEGKRLKMSVIRTILTIVLIIVSVILTVIVLMQEGKQDGLGAIAGTSETYWGKNRGLVKATALLVAVLFVLCILLDMSLF